MKKLYAYFVALFAALFCAATLLSPAVAGAEAEELPVIKVLYAGDYRIEAVIVDEEPLTEIRFTYSEEEFSFYWEGELDTGRDLWVQIRNGNIEGGGYVE